MNNRMRPIYAVLEEFSMTTALWLRYVGALNHERKCMNCDADECEVNRLGMKRVGSQASATAVRNGGYDSGQWNSGRRRAAADVPGCATDAAPGPLGGTALRVKLT